MTKLSKNLITIDQLSVKDIEDIHNRAETYFLSNREHGNCSSELSGKVLINFFFENSTRTRTSFEIAAKRLGVEVVNIAVALSALKKGESIIDTSKTIDAMRPDFVVIRHNSSGIVSLLNEHIEASLINAGDGTNEHPTQALLDSFVIRRNIKDKGINFSDLKIAICGDVLHSRVARSNIKLLRKLGSEVRVITPPTFITKGYREWLKESFDVEVFESLEEGIADVNVIMMLRIQQERMQGCYIPSLEEYFKLYGLTHKKISNAKPNVMVMHPGPMNREIEISSQLADDPEVSLVLEQVEAGVAVRQAILKYLSS